MTSSDPPRIIPSFLASYAAETRVGNYIEGLRIVGHAAYVVFYPHTLTPDYYRINTNLQHNITTMKNIIMLADSIFNANRNTNFNMSVQHLTQICSYVAEMLTASETRRGDLEVGGLVDITQEIFDECDPRKEDEVAKIVIELLDEFHIEDNQGPLFDIINTYVQDLLYSNETRAQYYNFVYMSALVNAIRIKDKVKLYVETSFNSIFNRACDIVANEESAEYKYDISELLFSGKVHPIMNISYNFTKLVEGVQNAYLEATKEQLCIPHVNDVTKKAFEHYLDGFDRTVKMAIASTVEDGPSSTRDKLFFEPYIDEAIDMLKLLLGK